MTKEIATIRKDEITNLHNEIKEQLKTSMEKAFRIGQLLVEQKAELKHGEFTPWIESNLLFTDRTARRYMNIFENWDKLKTDSVSDLTTAYKMLEKPKKEIEDWKLVYNVHIHQEIKALDIWETKLFEIFFTDKMFHLNLQLDEKLEYFKKRMNEADSLEEFNQLDNELLDIQNKIGRHRVWLYESKIDFKKLTK